MPSATFITGASGTGKSTRARMLAGDCNPARLLVISTDVVRVQLRATLDSKHHPELLGESFSVPELDSDEIVVAADGTKVNVGGFFRQCQTIMRAVNAAVEYALTEGWDVISEGIHLMPGLVAVPEAATSRFELIHIDDSQQHEERFREREAASLGGRPAAHYIANLPRIAVIRDEISSRWEAWLPTVADNPRVSASRLT